ncbi:hypothetical protein F5Y17DRAFT_389130 [Xylariaceae sp. FL0594]|nr:hypothetical protein F5Y17DRAFT_389130 [Xylariaceae sp. FL0594]
MADRAPPAHIRPGTNRVTRAATSTAGVRRNLFQSHISRRPTPAGDTGTSTGVGGHRANTMTSSSSTSADTLRIDAGMLSDSSDIVVREQNGEFEMSDPPLLLQEQGDETSLDDMQESQRERQRLAEAVRHHQVNYTQSPAQPEEMLEVLRASMRAKVAALAEDNWMYEPGDEVRAR